MRWAACALVIAAGCGEAQRPRARSMLEQVRNIDEHHALAARLAGRDAAGLRRMLRDQVGYGGLWFDDATCRREFLEPRIVPAAELDALASCVAGLRLRVAHDVHAIPDVAILSYDAGIEIEAELAVGANDDHTQILWIGFVGSTSASGWLPTISDDALESLRVAGGRDDYSAADRALLAGEAARAPLKTVATAWRVCVGTDGAVSSAHPYNAISNVATQIFRRTIERWRFRPFVLGGQAMPACAQVTLTEPGAVRPPAQEYAIPPLDPSAEDVPLGKRIAGDVQLVPDDATKMRIAPGSHFVAVFRFCTDEAGRVHDVNVYEPSGVPGYDDRIVAAIRGWRYEPSIVAGHPARACGVITFVYGQY